MKWDGVKTRVDSVMLGKTGNFPLKQNPNRALLLWGKILQIGIFNSEGGEFNL